MMKCPGSASSAPNSASAITAAASPSAMDAACSVCLAPTLRRFQVIDRQAYWRCKTCQATLLDTSHRLDRDSELARYRQHQNDPSDPRYRLFLNQLTAPLLAKLSPGDEGLDYGCGPGPALAAMLTEAGHPMQLYDPFFYPDTTPLQKAYAFITCTETVEHFHRPAHEFGRLDRLLLPGGWLGIMTCFQDDDRRFEHWHYRRDPTHVVFYREATFRYLAQQWHWHCEVPARNVVLLRKPCRQ